MKVLWEKGLPEEENIPSLAIVKFLEKLKQDRVNMHGVAMICNDKLIAEGYWKPFNRDSLHRMYSVGKSFTSLAIGLLEEEGKIVLTDSICKYFQDKLPVEGVHPWIGEMTIKDMLCMTTTHRMTTYKRYINDDWVESFFQVEPTHKAGTIFSYDTSSTHVLAALVERLTGKELIEYLREKCLNKIGFSREAYFIKDQQGISQGGSGLVCTLRDLLVVAKLCLNEGMHEGEQLLPKKYLKEATANQVDTIQQPFLDEQFGYGYQIWKTREEGFCFYGMGGQLAVCFPKYKFILATIADTQGSPDGLKNIYDAFYQQVYPYINKSMVKSTELELEKVIEELSIIPIQQSTRITQKRHISGNIYQMKENGIGLQQVTFEIEDGYCVMEYIIRNKRCKLTFGVNQFVKQEFPGTHYKCMNSGNWLRNHVLYVKSNIIDQEYLAHVNFVIVFKENSVTISMKQVGEQFAMGYDGIATGYIIAH